MPRTLGLCCPCFQNVLDEIQQLRDVIVMAVSPLAEIRGQRCGTSLQRVLLPRVPPQNKHTWILIYTGTAIFKESQREQSFGCSRLISVDSQELSISTCWLFKPYTPPMLGDQTGRPTSPQSNKVQWCSSEAGTEGPRLWCSLGGSFPPGSPGLCLPSPFPRLSPGTGLQLSLLIFLG